MPEWPDLHVVRGRLEKALVGREITLVRVGDPTVLRATKPIETALAHRRFTGVRHRGKFLMFDLDRGRIIVNKVTDPAGADSLRFIQLGAGSTEGVIRDIIVHIEEWLHRWLGQSRHLLPDGDPEVLRQVIREALGAVDAAEADREAAAGAAAIAIRLLQELLRRMGATDVLVERVGH